MQSELLMYVGVGIVTGALLLGLVVSTFSAANPQNGGFRYGAFFIRFASIFGAGYYVGASVLAVHFLGAELGAYLAIVFGIALIGLVVAALRLRFRSKAMLFAQSVPLVFCYPLLPLAVWNVIYAFAVLKKETWEKAASASRQRR